MEYLWRTDGLTMEKPRSFLVHEREGKVRPSEVIVLNVEVLLTLTALVVEEDDILLAHWKGYMQKRKDAT